MQYWDAISKTEIPEQPLEDANEYDVYHERRPGEKLEEWNDAGAAARPQTETNITEKANRYEQY